MKTKIEIDQNYFNIKLCTPRKGRLVFYDWCVAIEDNKQYEYKRFSIWRSSTRKEYYMFPIPTILALAKAGISCGNIKEVQ